MAEALKHLFILSPKAFFPRRRWAYLQAQIAEFAKTVGEEDCLLHVSRYPREAVGFIRAYAKSMQKDAALRVYAAGDAGLLFDCLNGVAGVDNTQMAALPQDGYGGFAWRRRKLAEPEFFDPARPAVPDAAIKCNGNYAASDCVIGAWAQAADSFARLRAFLGKRIRLKLPPAGVLEKMLFAAGWVLASANNQLAAREWALEVDGEISSGKYQSIAVLMDEGELVAFLVQRMGLFQTLKVFSVFFSGGPPENIMARLLAGIAGALEIKRGLSVNVTADAAFKISLDREIFFERQAALKAVPAAFRSVGGEPAGAKGSL